MRKTLKVVSKVISKIMKKIFEEFEQSRIRFKFRNNLIYYIFDNERKRLCISHFIKKKVFYMIYDLLNYGDFHKTYNYLLSFIYI